MWRDCKGQKEFTVDSIDTSNQNGTEERGQILGSTCIILVGI